MTVRSLLTVVLGLSCLGAGRSGPDESSVRQRLVGTWRVVSCQGRSGPEEAWKDLFGPDPRGYIMYDATGHMAVQLARLPRPRFASGDDRTPTAEEGRDAYLGYAAYCGTYSVDEASHVVTHHVEASLTPSYVGTDQLRPAVLDGERLTLSDGKTFRVVWERVR